MKSEPVIAGFTWSPVAGNSGYIVQIQNKEGHMREFTVTGESFRTELPPGDYMVRLAALNRFKKPSVWTPWHPFTLTVHAKEQSVSAAPDTQRRTPSSHADDDPHFFKWSYFIPGAARIRDGAYISGSLWSIPFAAAALYGRNEKIRGDLLAEKPLNDPLKISVLTAGKPPEILMLLAVNRNNDRIAYNRHQQNQRNIAWGAFILYLIQYADAVFYDYQTAKRNDQSTFFYESLSSGEKNSPDTVTRIGYSVRF